MKSICTALGAALVSAAVLAAPAEAGPTNRHDAHASPSRSLAAKTAQAQARAEAVRRNELRARMAAAFRAKRQAAWAARRAKPQWTPRASLEPTPEGGPGQVQIAGLHIKIRSTPMRARVLAQADPETARQPALPPLFEAAVMAAGLIPQPRPAPLAPNAQPTPEIAQAVIETIRQLSPRYGVPTWFALRIAAVESGYDPSAKGAAGEFGVFQIKCPTARFLGFRGACGGLLNATTNVHWGLQHLALAITASAGDLRLAASKHNGGLGYKRLVRKYVNLVF